MGRRPVLSAVLAAMLTTSLLSAGTLGAAAEDAEALFSSKHTAAAGPTESIGFYSRGCLSGGVQLPADGPNWQAMRLKRDRHWGHPATIAFLERLSERAAAAGVWNGLLVGDLSQARGGPMPWGHSSHQIGLDADIWLQPMPEERLSEAERDDFPFRSVLADGRNTVDENVWNEDYRRLIELAAADEEVQRIIVHPGIKKKLCETVTDDRSWLHKVRPYWGHHEHMHVRLFCQDGSGDCETQKATGSDTGCGAPLDWWYDEGLGPRDATPAPREPDPPMQTSALPDRCRVVAGASAAAADTRSPGAGNNGPGTGPEAGSGTVSGDADPDGRYSRFAPPGEPAFPSLRPARETN